MRAVISVGLLMYENITLDGPLPSEKSPSVIEEVVIKNRILDPKEGRLGLLLRYSLFAKGKSSIGTLEERSNLAEEVIKNFGIMS